jgi:hypothetical protein
MAASDEAPRCVYCGRPARGGRTCEQHRDLEQLDPAGAPARRPTTEAELGVRNPLKVPKRAGREELY